jgi:hypothetical protein
MRRYLSNRTVVAGAAIGIALSACNEILDNDPRSWDPNAGEEAGAPASGSGGEPGKGGAGGKGGASGKGGAAGGKGGASGRGGSASSGRGGAATGEAGESGGTSIGGEAAIAGAGGEDNASGAGGTPVVCECTPGTTQDNVEPCGDCLTGMRTQTKTCLDDCTWGQFGAFGECLGVTATCSPGTPGSQTVPCPCGGTKSQARSCTDACEWSGWSDTSGCDLECCSEIVYCNTPDNISPASRGTWCRETQSACSNEEVNADCHVDISEVCGSLVPDLYIEYR